MRSLFKKENTMAREAHKFVSDRLFRDACPDFFSNSSTRQTSYAEAIRAAWPNEEKVIAATAAWVNSAKPGSSDKRSYLMFKAGALFESSAVNDFKTADHYIGALAVEIATS